MDVERQKSNTQQAEVHRFVAEKSTAFSTLERLKEEVAQLQACCFELWHHLDITQYEREGYLSQELEWMYVAERRRESAVTGSGRVGIDDTILTKG